MRIRPLREPPWVEHTDEPANPCRYPPCPSHANRACELFELLLTDTTHAHEVLDGRDRAVRIAIAKWLPETATRCVSPQAEKSA